MVEAVSLLARVGRRGRREGGEWDSWLRTPGAKAYHEAIATCFHKGQHADVVRLYEELQQQAPDASDVTSDVISDGDVTSEAPDASDAISRALTVRALAAQGDGRRALELLQGVQSHVDSLAAQAAAGDAVGTSASAPHTPHTPPTPTSTRAAGVHAELRAAVDATMEACEAAADWKAAVGLLAVAGAVSSGGRGHGAGQAAADAVGRPEVLGGERLRALAMRACTQASQWAAAIKVFERAQAVCVPSAQEWRQALTSYAAVGEWDKWRRAATAMAAMDAKGLHADTDAFVNAATACVRSEAWTSLGEVMGVVNEIAHEIARDQGSLLLSATACGALRACESAAAVDAVLAATAVADGISADGCDAVAQMWQVRSDPPPPRLEAGEGRAPWWFHPHAQRRRLLAAALTAYASAAEWQRVCGLVGSARAASLRPRLVDASYALALASRASQWEVVLQIYAAATERGRPAAAAAAAALGSKPAKAVAASAPSRHRRALSSHLTALKACRHLGAWQRAVGILGTAAVLYTRRSATRLASLLAPTTPATALLLPSPGRAAETSEVDAFRTSALNVAMSACLSHETGDGEPLPAALDAALDLLQCAEEEGIADGCTYGAGMQALVLQGRLEEAVGLHDRAVGRRISLNLIETNIAIGAAARCGRMRAALAILRAAPRRDVGTYDAVLPELVRSGSHAVALRLFEEMTMAGERGRSRADLAPISRRCPPSRARASPASGCIASGCTPPPPPSAPDSTVADCASPLRVLGRRRRRARAGGAPLQDRHRRMRDARPRRARRRAAAGHAGPGAHVHARRGGRDARMQPSGVTGGGPRHLRSGALRDSSRPPPDRREIGLAGPRRERRLVHLPLQRGARRLSTAQRCAGVPRAGDEHGAAPWDPPRRVLVHHGHDRLPHIGALRSGRRGAARRRDARIERARAVDLVRRPPRGADSKLHHRGRVEARLARRRPALGGRRADLGASPQLAAACDALAGAARLAGEGRAFPSPLRGVE